MTKNTILVIIGLILVGMFSLLVGLGLGWKGQLVLTRFSGRPQMGRVSQFPSRMVKERGAWQGILQGQITKIDNNNVTLQLPNGQTNTFIIGNQTVVDKPSKGTKNDLQTGQNITVFGGSFLNGAQTVIINP